MDLKYIHNKIQDNLASNGVTSPFALALVGSRVTGYNTEKSDYDFNAIFKKNQNMNYINFFLNKIPISIKIQDKQEFESNLQRKNPNTEKSRFVYLPYKAMENPEYFKNKEKETRKRTIEDFTSRLPEDKEVKTNIKKLVEYPLIKYTLLNSAYESRLRRINNSGCGLIERMGPKYKQDLKEMGFFVSSKDEVVFKNKGEQERLNNAEHLRNIKKRYDLAKQIGVKPAGYILGGVWFLSQLPLEVYNSFENFPRIEKLGGEYYHSGPSIQEFLDKRKNMVPFENISKKMKDKIIHNFLS